MIYELNLRKHYGSPNNLRVGDGDETFVVRVKSHNLNNEDI